MNRLLKSFIPITICLLALQIALATSSNYRIDWSIPASGGGARNSTSYKVSDTTGQATIGTSSSTNYQLCGGYQCGILVPPGTAAVFRVTREGNVYADRAYYGADFQSGTGADIAEYINVSEPVEPGDVVELDPKRPGYYRKSRGPHSTLVAGVISSTPGITMGQLLESPAATLLPIPQTMLNNLNLASAMSAEHLSLTSLSTSPDNPLPLTFEISLAQLTKYLPALMEAENKPLLALMGIVPVKATTESGPIQPGDLLTTSSTPGYAMRCAGPTECEGAIIGKALEPLQEGAGLIKILVMR